MRSQILDDELFYSDCKGDALDLTCSSPRSTNSTVVNWLTQNPTPPPTVSPSPPLPSEDPFSCLYLLASAAVGELERQRLKTNGVQSIALTVNS